MEKPLISGIVAVCVMFLLDAIWIGWQSPRYAALVRDVQKAEMSIRHVYAVVAYIILAVTLVIFALPIYQSHGWPKTFLLGALLYGTFNFTNLALFSDYNLVTGILDTLWGGTLITLSCAIATAVV